MRQKSLNRLLISVLSFSLYACSPSSPATATGKDGIPLANKIGQMLIVGFEGKTLPANSSNPIVSQIEQGQVGGVILFDYQFQKKIFDKNIESPEQVKALIVNLQAIAAKTSPAIYHTALPLFVSVDYEGGKINRLKTNYGFPETLTAAKLASLSDEIAHHYVVKMAETLKRTGFNMDFAPVLDVNVNPENPIIGKLERSFSADPSTVTFFAELFAHAFTERKIACVYKHFPGHGSSDADSHQGFVDVTDSWRKEELIPYLDSFKKQNHCPFVMTAHIVNRQLDPTGTPATLSKPILTDLLRKKLKFKDIIITDDLQMQAITNNYTVEQAVVQAINAGADMLIFGNQLVALPQSPKEIIDIVMKHVESGDIERKRIEEAYLRIVAIKKRMLS